MAASTKKDFLFKHLNVSGRQKLRILLTPESDIGNWKMLAEKMGFNMEEIDYFATKPEPVDTILKVWCDKKGSSATMNTFLEYLQIIGRYDVIEDLSKYIEEMPAFSENGEQGSSEELCSGLSASLDIEEEDRNNVTRSDRIYDALICYAREDVEIAEELLATLESSPYNFSMCIDYRDFGVGGDHLTNLATIIEQRVKRIVVILTKNFVKCDQCDYQAKVALNLSPGCRKKKVIPILYDKDVEIPIILKHITLLDHTRSEVRKYLNERLANALGYKDSGKKCCLPQEPEKSCAARDIQKEKIEKQTALTAGDKVCESMYPNKTKSRSKEHGKIESVFKRIKKGRKK